MMNNKRSQEETLGFVLIVVLVTIIALVFLYFTAVKKPQKETSAELSRLLSAMMYHTTDCAVNYIPQYRDTQDLIKECFRNPEQNCLSGEVCMTLNELGSLDYFILYAKQGPPEHFRYGDSDGPVLVFSGLKQGEIIIFNEIEGTVYSNNNMDSADCLLGYPEYESRGPFAGFYDSSSSLVEEHKLGRFKHTLIVPKDDLTLYAYYREPESDRARYYDNRGECSFVAKLTRQKAVDNTDKICTTLKKRNVCVALEESVDMIMARSLMIGEESVYKGYRLNMYYSPNPLKSDERTEPIFSRTKGRMSNCTIRIGSVHTMALTSTSGSINVELDACR